MSSSTSNSRVERGTPVYDETTGVHLERTLSGTLRVVGYRLVTQSQRSPGIHTDRETRSLLKIGKSVEIPLSGIPRADPNSARVDTTTLGMDLDTHQSPLRGVGDAYDQADTAMRTEYESWRSTMTKEEMSVAWESMRRIADMMKDQCLEALQHRAQMVDSLLSLRVEQWRERSDTCWKASESSEKGAGGTRARWLALQLQLRAANGALEDLDAQVDLISTVEGLIHGFPSTHKDQDEERSNLVRSLITMNNQQTEAAEEVREITADLNTVPSHVTSQEHDVRSMTVQEMEAELYDIWCLARPWESGDLAVLQAQISGSVANETESKSRKKKKKKKPSKNRTGKEVLPESPPSGMQGAVKENVVKEGIRELSAEPFRGQTESSESESTGDTLNETGYIDDDIQRATEESVRSVGWTTISASATNKFAGQSASRVREAFASSRTRTNTQKRSRNDGFIRQKNTLPNLAAKQVRQAKKDKAPLLFREQRLLQREEAAKKEKIKIHENLKSIQTLEDVSAASHSRTEDRSEAQGAEVDYSSAEAVERDITPKQSPLPRGGSPQSLLYELSALDLGQSGVEESTESHSSTIQLPTADHASETEALGLAIDRSVAVEGKSTTVAHRSKGSRKAGRARKDKYSQPPESSSRQSNRPSSPMPHTEGRPEPIYVLNAGRHSITGEEGEQVFRHFQTQAEGHFQTLPQHHFQPQMVPPGGRMPAQDAQTQVQAYPYDQAAAWMPITGTNGYQYETQYEYDQNQGTYQGSWPGQAPVWQDQTTYGSHLVDLEHQHLQALAQVDFAGQQLFLQREIMGLNPPRNEDHYQYSQPHSASTSGPRLLRTYEQDHIPDDAPEQGHEGANCYGGLSSEERQDLAERDDDPSDADALTPAGRSHRSRSV